MGESRLVGYNGQYKNRINTQKKEQPKNIGRREFLKMAGLASGAVALGGFGIYLNKLFGQQTSDVSGENEIYVEPTEVSEQIEIQNTNEEWLKLGVNTSDGLPEFYMISGRSERYPIDREQIKVAIELSKSSGEPEIAVYQPITEERKYYQDLGDRSIENLPEDVMTDEELEDCHIRIIQPAGDKTRIYFRKGALEEGNLLGKNGEWKRGHDAGVEDSLWFQSNILIVGLDSGMRTWDSMSEDRYIQARELLGLQVKVVDVDGYRKKRVLELKNSLELIRKDISSGKKTVGELADIMLFAKSQIIETERASDDELKVQAESQTVDEGAYGQYFSNKYMKDSPLDWDVIVMPTEDSGARDHLMISVDGSGRYNVTVVLSRVDMHSMEPRREWGDLDPDFFGWTEDNYRLYFPSVTWAHEFGHRNAGADERGADLWALDYYRRASERLKNGDDAGYGMVIKLEDGKYVRM